MIDQERRNEAIRKCFYEQLGKGMPIMEAYSLTGQRFYLSEERVRQIVAKRKAR
jgi:DNA polymerase III delta subunit